MQRLLQTIIYRELLYHVSFKWTHTKYINYLIRQLDETGVNVHLNTEATTDMMRQFGYEAVIIAVGAMPVKPEIKGIDLPHDIGKNVVIIGGGDIGVDCGMGLASKGHNVFVIEKLPMLASGSAVMHYYSHIVKAWSSIPSFKYAVNADVIEITPDSVKYKDSDGNEFAADADTVLYAVGLTPKTIEAVDLFNPCEYEGFLVGDCEHPSNIQEINRMAYGTASRL